ncbi:hypothetical protein T05_10487 [Trichinella murrelli]|uniref:Uncharacterized protein n=1 Tax=Trichinella murrelli TaxID=144512 RepID=A0A0V0SZM7_9BILA|nr:hypothetical protein T05_10487 [Trichinella murrelli]
MANCSLFLRLEIQVRNSLIAYQSATALPALF